MLRLLAASGIWAIMAGVALGQSGGTFTDLPDQDNARQETNSLSDDEAAVPPGQIEPVRSVPATGQIQNAPQVETVEVAEGTAEARLAELVAQTAEAEARLRDLGQQNMELEQQVAELAAQRDAARAEIAALDSRRTEAEAALAQAQQQEAELRQGLEEATTRQTAAEAAALDAERRQAEAEQGFAAAQELRAIAEAALVETAAELEQLTAAPASLEQDVARLTAEPPQPDATPSAPPETATTSPAVEPHSSPLRSAARVDEALSRAPALGTGPQRAELRRRLMQGECPPAALKGAYDQINRQTLLALVADLGACP